MGCSEVVHYYCMACGVVWIDSYGPYVPRIVFVERRRSHGLDGA